MLRSKQKAVAQHYYRHINLGGAKVQLTAKGLIKIKQSDGVKVWFKCANLAMVSSWIRLPLFLFLFSSLLSPSLNIVLSRPHRLEISVTNYNGWLLCVCARSPSLGPLQGGGSASCCGRRNLHCGQEVSLC